MERRDFLRFSGAALASLTIGTDLLELDAANPDRRYSIVILGDTHFDAEPASVYHSNYNEPVEWLNRVQRAEFARNGQMWRERCPRILKRAKSLIDGNTRMIFQMGDLIQGDCGSPEVHTRMLDDVMNSFKEQLGDLPFVTVVGNHDIRGVGAREAYDSYMPQRESRELGVQITNPTFSFWIGDDAYIVIDFNSPDDDRIERLLEDTADARHTFIISHGPIFPFDDSNCRWFFHGGEKEKHVRSRLHFREAFAKRNAIVLCGHTHFTEFADWYGDSGRITQMTMNSVWAKEEDGLFLPDSTKPEQYGTIRLNKVHDNGKPVKDESELFDEYRPGLRRYLHSHSAGCYKMTVGGKHIAIDFYCGDSEKVTRRFQLR